MRIVTSLLLAALVLAIPLTVIAAPTNQSSVDIKSLALTRSDLPRGFEVVPDRTVSEERPDGVAVYDVTFARERTAENLAAGPFEIRSGVARTTKADDAKLQLESTKEAFLADGWADAPVPALGDETLGLTQTTDGEGGQIAHFAYLFRKSSLILMVGVRGRPDATKMEDALGLAIKISGRVDSALGAEPAAAPASGSTTRQGSGSTATGERVRVVNTDGGSANVRAEPSTSAEVVAQVAEGTTLEIVGANREGDGRTWRNVRTDGKTGWIAATLVETVATPPPAPPAPAPSPSPAPAGPAAPVAATEPTEPAASEPAASEPAAEATPSPSPSPTSSSGSSAGSGTTTRASANGIDVEISIRDATLSGGTQLVKVLVTRNGGPVADARVDVTARLDATRYRAIKAPRTNGDGRSEVEWEMEGPPGTYEVIVDVRTSDDGPATTAKGSFRWR